MAHTLHNYNRTSELYFIFLIRVFSLPGVLAQGQLQQSGPGAVKSREPLTLTCTLSRSSLSTAGSSWNWIRCPVGGRLEWMGNIWNSAGGSPTNYAGSQFSLQLRALTAADTATYYCSRGIHTHTPGCTVTQCSRGTYKKGKRVFTVPERGDKIYVCLLQKKKSKNHSKHIYSIYLGSPVQCITLSVPMIFLTCVMLQGIKSNRVKAQYATLPPIELLLTQGVNDRRNSLSSEFVDEHNLMRKVIFLFLKNILALIISCDKEFHW
uniref:Ig-like domain-containing protein n=1 Tax=Chrysemys picta bellii TaxID=8478 RepID=A0A8C3I1K1_CHRPI